MSSENDFDAGMIDKVFHELGITPKKQKKETAKGNVSCMCPFHNDGEKRGNRSFSFNRNGNVFECFSSACKAYGKSTMKDLFELCGKTEQDFWNVVNPPKEEAENNSIPSLNTIASKRISDQTKQYLEDRGIIFDKVKDYVWELKKDAPEGFEKNRYYGNKLVIPSIPGDDRQTFIKLRDVTNKAKLKEVNRGDKRLIGRTENPETVIITEGGIDYLTYLSYVDGDVYSMPDAGYRLKDREIKQLPETIYLCLDNDSPGRKGSEQTANDILRIKPKARIYEVKLPPEINDLNDYVNTFPAEERTSKILELITKAGSRPFSTYDQFLPAVQDIAEALEERLMEAELHGYKEAGTKAISVGVESIDDLLKGGLRTGLISLAGMPGVAKTNTCLALCKQLTAQGNTCIFFSLEMGKREILSRLLSCAADVSYHRIIDQTVTREEMTRISKAIRQNQKVFENFHVYDTDRTVDYFKDIVLKYTNAGIRPVVFIDYLQQIASNDKGKDPRLEMKEISYGLKDLAVNYDLPVIVISSVPRSVYLNKGKDQEQRDLLSVFKESGDIEYSLYVGLFLDYARSEDNGKPIKTKDQYNDMVLYLVKNRFGKVRKKNG